MKEKKMMMMSCLRKRTPVMVTEESYVKVVVTIDGVVFVQGL